MRIGCYRALAIYPFMENNYRLRLLSIFMQYKIVIIVDSIQNCREEPCELQSKIKLCICLKQHLVINFINI